MLPTHPWCCPRCHGILRGVEEQLVCVECCSGYPVIAGIPDFRLELPSWIDPKADRERARILAAQLTSRPVSELVAEVFGSRSNWSDADVARRTREILAAPKMLVRQLDGWLRPASSSGPFLDLGCGPGQLLAAAALSGRTAIGVDVMLEWLVVAKALVAENGGEAVVAAGMAEALPLRSKSITGAVSLDVIEHVGNPEQYLRELDRVMAPGGSLCLATPNRYSLSAEPHVNAWGVGWLPSRWQSRYVAWRTGKSYEYTRLLSVWELRRLFAAETQFAVEVLVPSIPHEHIERFRRSKAMLARLYNVLVAFPPSHPVFRAVGPFFRVLARKL